MAVRGVINEFFNLEEFQKQITTVTDGIGKYIELVKTAPTIRSTVSDPSKVKETLNGLKQLADQNSKIVDINTRVVTTQRELDKAMTEAKISRQEYNKELKTEIQLEQAVIGSINEAKAKIAALTIERNNLNLKTAEGTKRLKEINDEVNKNNEFIEANASKLEKRKINVGNYEGSAKLIVDAFEKARQKVEAVSAEFGPVSPEAQRARKEFEALDRITQNPRFLNIAANVGDTNKELRFFTQQLNSLEDAGLKNSEVYRDIRTRLAQLTDQMGDTRAEVKALASDTRSFDLFAGSVNFAADAFQTFAGAAALATGNEEESARITKTLIAIQSVSNGVKGIANELTTKGTAANKVYALVQAQVAIATNASATATQRLSAILKISGVGLLISGLGFLISKLSSFGDTSEEVQKETEKLTEAIQKQRDAVNDLNASIDQSLKLNIERIKQAGIQQKKTQEEIDQEILNSTIAAKEKEIKILEAQEERSFKTRVSNEIQFQKDIQEANIMFGKNLNESDISGKDKENLENRRKALREENEKDKKALKKAQDERDLILAQGTTKQLTDQKNLSDKQKQEAEKAAKEAKERFDRELQASLQIGLIAIQQGADFNKEIADDDKRSIADRLYALQQYGLSRESIINQIADTEKKLGKKTASELKLIDEKRADELLRLQREISGQGQEILRTNVKAGAEITQEEANHINEIGQKTLDGFKERSERELEIAKDLLEKKKEIRDAEKELYKNLYGELEGFAVDFFTAEQDRQIAHNEDESARIDERKQKDIDYINQTVTDRAKAADDIKIIEAKAQADKEVLANKNKDLERKKQTIEKFGKIAEIVGNTAQGVASLSVKAAEARAQAALLASNPLTAAFAPVALANSALIAGQIPLVIGIGAAQIARLAIPKFKHGGITPGGIVEVGDGGKSEGVKLPDGTILKTPATNTFVDLPKGSQVFPDFEKMMLSQSIKEVPEVRVIVPYNGTEKAIKQMGKDIVTTIKNKQENHWHMPGRYELAMRDGSRFRAYLNTNL